MTDSATPQGVVASMTATVGIVPTQEGKLEIPEIRIPWWNTITDRQEEAVIPARTMIVSSGTAPSVQVPQVQELPQGGSGVRTGSGTASSLWLYVALVFAALWLLTLWQFFLLRQKVHVTDAIDAAPAEPETLDPYKQLKDACRSNDAEAARRALFAWGKLRYPNIHSLGDLVRETSHPGLRDELAAMEAAQFAPAATRVWEGAALLTVVDELQAVRSGSQSRQQLVSTLNPPS